MLGKFSRRHFGKLAGAFGLGMTAAPAAAQTKPRQSRIRSACRELPERLHLGHGDVVLSGRRCGQ